MRIWSLLPGTEDYVAERLTDPRLGKINNIRTFEMNLGLGKTGLVSIPDPEERF
jgi:hypothetical protein